MRGHHYYCDDLLNTLQSIGSSMNDIHDVIWLYIIIDLCLMEKKIIIWHNRLQHIPPSGFEDPMEEQHNC